MRVLVTGSGGFIGSEVRDCLASAAALVCHTRTPLKHCAYLNIFFDLSPDTDWIPHLSEVDVVVHIASVAHVRASQVDEDELELVNVLATERLAKDCLAAGVKKFIFLSSIGVNGNETFDAPFSKSDQTNPHNAYSFSKLKAEMKLDKIFQGSSVELIVLRLPLVYGGGAPGNIALLRRFINKFPANPFVRVHNKRSVVSVESLARLIRELSLSDRVKSGLYLVSDATYSTSDLLNTLAREEGRKLFPLPIPKLMFDLLRCFPFLRGTIAQLTGSLEVESSPELEVLTWKTENSLMLANKS